MAVWLPEFLAKWLSRLKLDTWSIIGFVGMATFSSRFIVQWIASEIKKESVIPVAFWHLSIIGSVITLSYALKRADVVFILMYVFNCLIYFRNLYFIYKKRKREVAA